MRQPSQDWNSSPLSQKIESVKFIMYLAALSVMVFMRKDLGYRLLNPLHLLSVCSILAVVSILADPGNPKARFCDLLVFALLAFVLGIGQRAKRWRELKRGLVQHSYYIGTSPFDYRWLPVAARRNRVMARFIDPVFCAIIGIFLLQHSHALGVWLIISGLSLRCYEASIQRKEEKVNFDVMDGLINSQIHSRIAEGFEEAHQERYQVPTTAIPTGLGSDIHRQVKRRKTK